MSNIKLFESKQIRAAGQKQGFQLSEIVKDYWAEGFDMYYMEYGHLKHIKAIDIYNI